MPSTILRPARAASAPDVLTSSDLARYLQVSKSSLYKPSQEGKVPGQQVGKHWRFRRETIDRWLDSRAPDVTGWPCASNSAAPASLQKALL